MDILKPLKSLMKRGKQIMDDQTMTMKTSKLNEEYTLAKNSKATWNNKFDLEERAYLGNREMGNIRTSGAKDVVRTPIRTSFMHIEAQIDTNIPSPVFKPVSADDEEAIKQLQSEVEYVVRSNPLDTLNSMTERTTKKHGTCIYKVKWNPKYKGAGYTGRVEIIEVHPKNILPAAGTIDITKAEAIYHIENETLIHCIKRYGEIAKRLPEFGDSLDSDYETVGSLVDGNVNKVIDTAESSNDVRPSGNNLSKYRITEKWYKDDDGEVGLTAWSGSLILSDEPKFYYRREVNPETGEVVTDKNGNKKLVKEEIIEDGYKHIPRGTTVKHHIPKELPFIFQYNIPRAKCVWGISDIEINNDIDEAIKKVIYKHEERLLEGTDKIVYNKEAEQEAALLLNNKDLQVVGVNDVNNIKSISLSSHDNGTIDFYNLLMDVGQQQLQITNVWKGMNSGEATSGKMADSLIRQTEEKISIKTNEKNIAYLKLYRLVCDFLLAFSIGDRPYRLDNGMQAQYGTFNRYNMLRKDKSGNWIYPDWDIEISAESTFPKTTTFRYESMTNMTQNGFLDPTPRNLLYWRILVKQGYPDAESVLQSLEEQVKQINQQMEQQQEQQLSQQQEQEKQISTQQQAVQEKNAMKQQKKDVETADKEFLKQVMQQLPPAQLKEFKKLSYAEQLRVAKGGK